MDEAVQEVLLLLGYGLGDEAGQRLQAARHRVQLVLQRADALVQLLAALLQLRHQVVHHILGLVEQRRREIRYQSKTCETAFQGSFWLQDKLREVVTRLVGPTGGLCRSLTVTLNLTAALPEYFEGISARFKRRKRHRGFLNKSHQI